MRITSLAIAAFVASSAQAETPKLTIFGPDTSGSSTFLFDPHSASAAGDYVERHIAALDAPHRLAMVSIGDPGLGQRQIDIRATITQHRATNARALSKQFGDYFRILPQMVREGRIEAQNSTSIVAFFQSLAPVCDQGATVILFTDGVEWSAEVDGNAFVAGTTGLPEPTTRFLDGCSIEMHGVGQLKSDLSSAGLEARLVPTWTAYLTTAGADNVRVTGSFFDF